MSVAAHREMRHSSLAVFFSPDFLQAPENHDMKMTRRDFLSASAALAVTPVFTGRGAAAPLPREADVVVIGAGAAGIAAARRIMAANRKVIVVEAASQLGGRCQTDSTSFPVPLHPRAPSLPTPTPH